MFYAYVIRGKMVNGTLVHQIIYGNASQVTRYFLQKVRGPFELIYYEACVNEQDARVREKYLKSGFGKRYLRSRLKRFLSPTGFSLLEVMVTVVVLSFGLLAIIHLFPIGLRASKISQDVTTATFLAQERIEELKSARYMDIDCASGTFEGPYNEFEWEQRVSEEISGWLKKVTVRVFWSRYGRTRNVKLTTFIANYQRKFR